MAEVKVAEERLEVAIEKSLLGHVSKIVSKLLSKLSEYPNIDTSLCQL